MEVEAFIITNGRSTFDHVLKSVQEQSLDIKITVIRNLKWIDAVNECVRLCESKFFIRVDDDMFLHPLCTEYMYLQTVNNPKSARVAACACKLWEDWQSYVAGSVKLYQTDRVKDMGGFQANKMGKIDKPFEAMRKKKRLLVIKDAKSVTGIHGMGTWKEQERYRSLWLKNNSKIKYKRSKVYLRNQRKYKKSPKEQYEMINNLRKLNKKRRSRFWRFIKNGEKV